MSSRIFKWIGGAPTWGETAVDRSLSFVGVLPLALLAISSVSWYNFDFWPDFFPELNPKFTFPITLTVMTAAAVPAWIGFVWLCFGINRLFRIYS
jgi:hypothetical protein